MKTSIKFARKTPGSILRKTHITPRVDKRLCIDPFSNTPPPIIIDIVNFLSDNPSVSEESIRSSGNKRDVQLIISTYSKRKQVMWEKYDEGTAFAVLKYFLANLPYPLLTNQLMECFMLAIELKSQENEGDQKVCTANLEAIKSTIQMLPDGQRATLRAICQILKDICASDTNKIKPSLFADCLSFELCYAKDHATSTNSEDAMKAHKLVETLINEFENIFEREIEVGRLDPIQEKQRAAFQRKLRNSCMELKAHLENAEDDYDEDSFDLTLSESVADKSAVQSAGPKNAPNTVYLQIQSENNNVLTLSTVVWKEMLLFSLFFFIGCIPVLLSFEFWRLMFTLMVAILLYLNFPRREVWEFNRSTHTATKEWKMLWMTKRKETFSLKELDSVTLQESPVKKSAFRLVLHFKTGIKVPMTDDYFFSSQILHVSTKLCEFTGL